MRTLFFSNRAFPLNIALLLSYVLIPLSVIGQSSTVSSKDDTWKVQHISVEQGLSNRFVQDVRPDSRGYLWISTNFGLNRYDGHHFDVLTRESHHLQSNRIHELYLDNQDQLWLIEKDEPAHVIKYIDILDPISLTVQPLEKYLSVPPPFKPIDIQDIVNDSTQQLFFLTRQNDVYAFDKNRFVKLFHITSDTQVMQLGVTSAFITAIVPYADSFDIWDRNGKWLKRNPAPYHEVMGDTMYWRPIGQLTGDKLLVVDDKPFRHIRVYSTIDMDGFSALHTIPDNAHEFCMFDIHQKRLWMKDSSQYNFLDLRTGYLEYQDTEIPFTNTRPSYSDSLGLTWFVSDNGVYVLLEKHIYFNAYLEDQSPIISCRGFAEDAEGNIYVFTLGRNFVLDPSSGMIQSITGPDVYYGLAATTDQNGNIWYTTESPICYRYTPATGQVRKFTFPFVYNSQYRYFASWSIVLTKAGQLLMGSTHGLWMKDPKDEADPIPFLKLNSDTTLAKSCIYHMLEADEGIWLSTDNGLFLVDMDKGVLDHINEQTNHLPNNNLLFLHKDADGIYWIASRGGGLIRWDRAKNTFRPYTVNEGLSHNVIYAIYEDDYGFLWMTSDFGLMRFEKETGICRTFLTSEGITHEEFNRASYFRDSKGYLYFGGLNGFITFHPKDLLDVRSHSLPVRLTKFEAIDEKTGETQDMTYAASSPKGIQLSPNISSFIIHYSILDYDDPQLKRFAYRIDGLNTNWTYLKENFIRINGLKGGDYKIHIKGQSSTGQWSENELVIPLRIQKPLIARWYSIAVFILIISGLAYFLIRKRSQLHKAKLEREMAISRQLRQIDKMKDQFLANTSHELRTPLNGMIGLVESLRENSHTEAEKEDLDLVISSGRRLSNLVNDILDFSRLKEHDLQLQLQPVDVRTIADFCLRMNRPLVQHKDVALINKVPENMIYCTADENRLQQILQNLIANAIKFTNSGAITLDAEQDNKMVVIRVSDTGIGIEKEKQDVIFKEFEQSDGSIAREYGGTGLGLSITRYLVELHGGNIQVDSTPGKGSVFSFTIPVYDGDKSVIAKKEKAVTGIRHSTAMPVVPKSKTTAVVKGENGSRRHILVVDDEPVNLKVLKNHLEHAGYLVTLASDGHEALQLVEHGGPFHLVLLDVMMPRISGYEVCQKIRERHLLTNLPVIMVTAKNQINDLVEGLGIGANDYIVKPFSRDELLSRVKTQLDQHHIHEATNRFVPHEFIHSLGRQSIIDLTRGDMVEQKVHVMFSDMRDYTSLAEDMTPQENFQFVNGLAGRVGPIVKKNQGMINQYLGDTIMMLFMKVADDGVQCGIDILRMIHAYNIQRQALKRKPVRLGIGLHSGSLMMGIIGDAIRMDAAVISDTVNTASRMEGLTKYYNVNFILSEDTILKLVDRDRFNLRYLGKVLVKGKNHTLDIYECFDGDSDEQIALKKASSPAFHAGMEAYFAKDMHAARKFFDQVYLTNPEDTTVLGFLHRIHNHLIQGLPAEWNGVEVMVTK